eukprot:TRINITY_DN13377_c0_g1_i1.p1 TRINITY_DN13377_c0_g1~~TRINITY_DN13377_c0_g1_i1.p1  ORF type:complete len:933 (-),score=143.86 TRINITY_DN13377_c0_g1_i1:137-2875(-)
MQNIAGIGGYVNYGAQAAALCELGARLKAAGDWRGAAERYYEVLSVEPGNYVAQLSLGSLYLAAGDLARALEHSEKAFNLEPRSSEAMCNIGSVCRSQGNHQAAVQWYRAALKVNPNCETTPMNLAVALINYGLQIKASDPKGAIRSYREALVQCPTSANAYYNLGVSYAEMHKYDKALINYQLTVHFDPRCAEAYNNMGVIYKEQENLDKALKCYHMAVQCNPRFAQTLNNLGVAYTTSGRLTEALEYLSRAVAAAPNYAEAYNNLGWLFWDHGDLTQALRMYERCIELSPVAKNPSQNRLLALNYLHGVPHERVFQAHTAWAERFCREVGAPYTHWPNAKVAGRQLRIGYISPDFFHHSVSFFVHALLEHRNKEQFDVFIYSNASREDDKTELFKSFVPADNWKKVVGRPAQEVAELIRADQIDILIELAGHTANNRLDVIAMKPAPVQITYIGYNNTTGLGAIDYRFVDEIVDPLDSPQTFSEELVRIPGCFLCYTPPARIPDVEALPALRNGFVTFGSFSCLAKVQEPCVALWARCLQEVPNSRLLVKNKGFYSPDVQATFINKFKAYGIAEHRLKLMALAPSSYEHLNIYNEVDLALDTFPYSNTTTTCEALLMGAPPVCLKGSSHGSRVCLTLLTAIGLSDFAADTEDEYVAKAKGLASNLQTLAMLRKNLRQILLASQLCDGPGFVRDKYEPLLQQKWQAYVDGRPPSQQVFSSSESPDPLSPGPFAPPLAPGQAFVQGPNGQPAVSSSAPAQAFAQATAPQVPPQLAGVAVNNQRLTSGMLAPPPVAMNPLALPQAQNMMFVDVAMTSQPSPSHMQRQQATGAAALVQSTEASPQPMSPTMSPTGGARSAGGSTAGGPPLWHVMPTPTSATYPPVSCVPGAVSAGMSPGRRRPRGVRMHPGRRA